MALAGKICVIGFQKTGTTSMAHALRALGMRVGNATGRISREVAEDAPDFEAAATKIALDVLAGHDAAEDSPYPFLFEAVDQAFTGTRFIQTTRSVDDWLESYRAYFPDRNNAMRRWMYGVDRLAGNEAAYKAVYARQNARIREYFSTRPNDLLVMDLAAGDGWHKLVRFLGPEYLPSFPAKNARPGKI